MALNLSFRFQSVDEVHASMKKSKPSKESMVQLLDKMTENGCLYRRKRNGVNTYAIPPLVVGLYELKAGDITPDYLKKIDDYTDSDPFMLSLVATKHSQMRTIPIEKAITPNHPIATYDQIRSLIDESGGPFLVINCICREKHDLQGEHCEKTDRREICLGMGEFATQVLEQGQGREISKQEALQLLEKNQEEGLVIQPGGNQDADFICSCCGCCCGMLRMQKRLPHPADFWTHDFHAEVNIDLCIGCGLCEKKCNVNAITVKDKKAIVNLTRCIGCGICVVSCKQEAIELVPVKDPKEIPKTYDDFYESIYKHKKGLLRRLFMGLKMRKGKRWYS
ncbi:MAG: 4Fe-4S dicluster domain-containing protein [Promethearchaeota archaeon]|nr:MAG: 4Fe-4S dicluster domain-containing protein [Candidatus Lokiarchaeota archaeon]